MKAVPCLALAMYALYQVSGSDLSLSLCTIGLSGSATMNLLRLTEGAWELLGCS